VTPASPGWADVEMFLGVDGRRQIAAGERGGRRQAHVFFEKLLPGLELAIEAVETDFPASPLAPADEFLSRIGFFLAHRAIVLEPEMTSPSSRISTSLVPRGVQRLGGPRAGMHDRRDGPKNRNPSSGTRPEALPPTDVENHARRLWPRFGSAWADGAGPVASGFRLPPPIWPYISLP